MRRGAPWTVERHEQLSGRCRCSGDPGSVPSPSRHWCELASAASMGTVRRPAGHPRVVWWRMSDYLRCRSSPCPVHVSMSNGPMSNGPMSKCPMSKCPVDTCPVTGVPVSDLRTSGVRVSHVHVRRVGAVVGSWRELVAGADRS